MEANFQNDYIRGHVEGKPLYFKERAEELANEFETNATVDKEGIARWNSNGNIPPKEVLEFWAFLGKSFNYEKSMEVQKQDTRKFLDDCFASQFNRKLNDEERFEMTSAFGKGANVVNILTGQIVKL